MAQQHKACTKCGEVKPLDGFHKNKRKRDGRQARCKECVAEYQRSYYEENRAERLERRRRHYAENREEVRECNRRYYEENQEQVREQHRRYREENREEILEYQLRYREENREIINAKISSHWATSQELSKALSSVPPQTPWSEGEDAFLMADNGMTVYEKAIRLGRTYASCAIRRQTIRKRRTTNV